jgi:hypothetical protein
MKSLTGRPISGLVQNLPVFSLIRRPCVLALLVRGRLRRRIIMGISLETIIDGCPSWGYLVVLIAAFGLSIYVAGWGMKLMGSLFDKGSSKPSTP